MRETTTISTIEGGLDAASVWAQYAQIAQSELFSHTDRFTRLLKFIVEKSLVGQEDKLLGKNIAYEVLNVDGNANMADHSSVRVEISRLRRLLKQYYDTEGAADPILIEIPKGAYRAVFSPNSSRPRAVRQRQVWVLASATVLVIALLAYLFVRPAPEIDGPEGMPIVAVLPFSVLDGSDPNSDTFIDGLSEDVITDLSKIGELRVIAHTSTEKLHQEIEDISSLAALVGASHVLRGTVQKLDDSYRLNVNLTDVLTRQRVWSERYDFSLDDRARIQIEIAKNVSEALSVALQPQELRAIELSKWDDVEAESLFRQAMSIAYPPNALQRLDAAEALINRIIEIVPDSSQGYSALALIQAYKAGFVHADTQATSAEVAKLTSHALEINPHDAMAYVALSAASQTMGNMDSAIKHARNAVELQPSLSLAWSRLGMALIFSGKAEEGINALETALRYDPNAPRQPYLNQLALAEFHAGNFEGALDALDRNIAKGGPYGPHMMIYRAAALAALGRTEEEQAVLTQMVAQTKETGLDWIREWLYRFSPHEEIIAPVLAELDKVAKVD